MNQDPHAAGPPPAVLMMQLITGKWVSQAVSVTAELGVADQLKDGPLSSAQLAAAVDANEDALYRLLRALTMVGLFREGDGRTFQLTDLGQLLRSDVPGNLRGLARFAGSDLSWRAWGHLLHSVRTGGSGFEDVFGEPAFNVIGRTPAVAAMLNDAMTGLSLNEGRATVAAYDFSALKSVVDVGGGHGLLLASILKANPHLKGILFELPHATAGAASLLQAENLMQRAEVVSGSFFESIPSGADGYILKHILHNWNDEQALAILKTCHRAMDRGATLIVVDPLVTLPNEPHFVKLLDLEMLVMAPGARERTLEEFRGLFTAAGFELIRAIPTQAPVSVIEGRRI